jgi:hypothetical protein
MEIFQHFLTAIYSLAMSRHTMESADYLSACRTQLDPFVFSILNLIYGEALQKFWDEYTIPLESDKAVVIVERRAHPNLKFCIQNAMYFCRGHTLHIVCSKASLAYVKSILGSQIHNIHIHPYFDTIGTPSQGYKEYNELLKTKQFWSMFPEEHIITLETDCYFLKPIPENIYQYDYVASIWPWSPEKPGGGGLTYRKRSMMLNICDKYTEDISPAQDAFVSDAVSALGYKYPTLEESNVYFTEGLCSNSAIGTHQWWTYIANQNETPFDIHTILKKIEFYFRLAVC